MYRDIHSNADTDLMFYGLIDELSELFLQISHVASATTTDVDTQRQNQLLISEIAEAAAIFTDAYVIKSRLSSRTQQPHSEPFMVSSVLYETMNGLLPIANRYQVELKLDGLPRPAIVHSDQQILKAALSAVGHVLMVAQSEKASSEPVTLAAYRSRYGIVTGVYMAESTLSIDVFRRMKQLTGRARQPLNKLVSGSAVGVMLADALLREMDAKLHVARRHNRIGFGVTLPVCNQLQLV